MTDASQTVNPAAPPPAGNAPISLQDVMSAGLASLIAAVTLALLCYCFWGASAVTAEHFKNEKDILALALGLLGTVTGYYFGRTPAEHQAQQATRAADTAQGNAQASQQSADKAHQKADAIRAEVARELAALAGANAPGPPSGEPVVAQTVAAPTLTPVQVQARMAALLARVTMIGQAGESKGP